MSDRFYRIDFDQSSSLFYKIYQICSGIKRVDYCSIEKAFYWKPYTDLVVNVDSSKELAWPDYLHDNHWEQYYVFSDLFYEMLAENGFGDKRKYPVKISNLKSDKRYYLLDGLSLQGGEIDYVKAGLGNYTICQECKTLRVDSKQLLKNYLAKFKPGHCIKNWNGEMLFTIGDEKNNRLYCTNHFIELVIKYKLSNFVFFDLEYNQKIIKYRNLTTAST